MKICIIGNSGHWAYALKELKNHTVTGVCPGFPGEDMRPVMSQLAENGISARLYDSFDMILPLSPQVAIINTRFDLNAYYTVKCLEQNIYVYSEKPLATTLEDLNKIETVKTTAFAVAMFGISYEPWCLTMRKYAKQIGNIRMANGRKSYKLGTRPDFYKDKKTFGGLIPWVGIHALHWIYFTTGLRFKQAAGVTDNTVNFGNGDLETTAAAVFIMENGCIATVTADYFRPTAAATHDDDRLRLVGDKGILEYMRGRLTLINDDGERELPLLPAEDTFGLFIKRISDGASGISTEESIYITKTALQADSTKLF